jgi:hypothetical protein
MLGVFGYFFGQKPQSDKAVEGYVLGLVDHTHPAAPEPLLLARSRRRCAIFFFNPS